MKSDKDILNYWFEKNDLSDASRELYTIAMNQYSKINKKTIGELYDEADKEEGQNIRLSKREYSFYAIKFKKDLAESGKSPQTIRLYLSAIKSFYNAYGIKQPDVKLSKGDVGLEKNYGRLLKKSEIQKLVSVASTRNRAIIYVMALSGLSQREVRDLTLKKFVDAAARELDIEIDSVEELLKHEKDLIKDKVLELEITRKKVNYRFHSFFPPETNRQILIYLKNRIYGNNDLIRIDGLKGPIFVMPDGKPITAAVINNLYRNTGQDAGLKHETGSYRSWRSHGMRKYFISTIINNLGDHILADYMAGHKIDSMKRRYWFADPETLKKKYLTALPYLSLEDVEVKTIESNEFQELKEYYINESKNKENEIILIKTEKDEELAIMNRRIALMEKLLNDEEYAKDKIK